ncbi:pre-mRNA-splicing factor 38B [Hyalella azteca]|uniref:Pre-mRNA-splicing factor 38 n=1 Tax=Hyalella azteca TaxID=294128 RepID=A0A979FMW1_HYAAZ|nr:pre-mRNA-splicing factor 38B [Hyalella azteca]
MAYQYEDDNQNEMEEEENEEYNVGKKKSNVLPIWGNDKTMNLNTLLLTNIQSSQYFKVKLYALKTYHEVLDEIYYQVSHLEPWEKGSRKTSGQTGMCGGVRGVGAGGIVSTAFCILYKLFTLRLTRKQVNGMLNHTDSPYIRGLGFMYLRYMMIINLIIEPLFQTMDVRAGGGQNMSIGELVRALLTKLEWHATLFPRIPVPIQKTIEKQLADRDAQAMQSQQHNWRDNGHYAKERADRKEGGSNRASLERLRLSHSKSRSRANSHDSGRRQSRNRDTERRDSRNRDTERRDSRNRDTERRDSRNRDTERRDSRNRDTERRDSRNRDTERRDRDYDRRDRDSGRRDKDSDRRDRDSDRRETCTRAATSAAEIATDGRTSPACPGAAHCVETHR